MPGTIPGKKKANKNRPSQSEKRTGPLSKRPVRFPVRRFSFCRENDDNRIFDFLTYINYNLFQREQLKSYEARHGFRPASADFFYLWRVCSRKDAVERLRLFVLQCPLVLVFISTPRPINGRAFFCFLGLVDMFGGGVGPAPGLPQRG